ncbi:urea ABC transporter permease subunit UrtC [Paenirhodobacter hankyongi]|uniref:Urea ABC transporter permease subunit UrtC n=1 Tax=Paenirhodobacter hankyongi TaxID=2294033 RepID=A0A421BQJ4_9RHOB|nr:urea ABC transporter permease subunit UrtC [Sinirhodobacter hankyongi]RLL65231.1 urea ABC transporter permease subunit UrtC [Sinirhodobacter hankyongi]
MKLRLTTRGALEAAAYGTFILVILLLPTVADVFWLNRFAKYLVYGMLGIAVALSWGYAGVLNLGQGLFFGLGAYMVAMTLKLQSETSMQQGADTPIPDFMAWNSQPGALKDLCCIAPGSWLWIPFQSQAFGIAMVLLVPTAVAFLIGWSIFRLRISGVFISIITLALVLLVRLLIVDWQPVTNGFNGLTDLGWLTFGGFEFDPYVVPTYYLVAFGTVAVLLLTRLLVATRAGLVLQATRDDANRARYLGYDVARYQVFFFTVSGLIAGIAGAFYVIASEFASPTFLDLTFSVSMVVWAAVGGRNSLLGACIGAILINTIQATVSESEMLAEAWKAIIGLIFVLVVLFLPRGIAGLARDIAMRLAALLGRGTPAAQPLQKSE